MKGETKKNLKCGICKKPASLRCSRCSIQFYCSRECQKKDHNDHELLCRTHRKYDDTFQAEALWNPMGNVYRMLAFDWAKDYARIEIAYAVTSAFKLTDHSQPSTLPSTHILILYCKFYGAEKKKRDQIRITGGMMRSREDFFNSNDGIDGTGWLQGDPFREDIKKFLTVRGLENVARYGLKPVPGRPYVRCPVILLGLNVDEDTLEVYPYFTHVVPTYNQLSTERVLYNDSDGDFWLEGLQMNLIADPVESEPELTWRSRLRMDVRRSDMIKSGMVKYKYTTEQLASVPNLKTFTLFPTRMIDDPLSTDSTLPPVFDRFLSHPTCQVKGCLFPSPTITPDPATDVERQRIVRDYLIRDFDDNLRIQAIRYVELEMKEKGLNEIRIHELLHCGLTLQQISTPAFLDSQAKALVRMTMNRYEVSCERQLGHEALFLSGPLAIDNAGDAMIRRVDEIDEMREAQKVNPSKLWRSPSSSEFDDRTANALQDMMMMLIPSDVEVATYLAMQCAHQLYDLSAVATLTNRRCRPDPIRKPTAPDSLFVSIPGMIKSGVLVGKEWEKEEVWKEKVRQGLNDFSISIRREIGIFISTTPTFGAIHRHFLQNFPRPLEFGAVKDFLTKSELKKILGYLERGGMMSADDEMVKIRFLEREFIKNDGVVGSSKSQRNAKKKAKKLMKKGNDVNVDMAGVQTELNALSLD